MSDVATKPRLKAQYDDEIISKLMEEFSYSNRMAAPKLQKICINVGLGKAMENKRLLDDVIENITLIAGQRAVPTVARQAVSTWRLRQGYKIGCKVTLRGDMMYEFLDRLITVAIPRVRDFRGLSPKAFDGRGNYSMGIEEHSVFAEINPDRTEFLHGMDITFVTSAKTDEEAKALLTGFGFPLRKS